LLLQNGGRSLLSASNGLCLLMLLAGPALWVLASRRTGRGRVLMLLLGSGLLTVAAFPAFRNDVAVWPLLVCTGVWLLAFLQLFRFRANRACLIALAIASVSLATGLAEAWLEVWPMKAGRMPEQLIAGDLTMVDATGKVRLIPNTACRHAKADFDVVYRTDADGGRLVPEQPRSGPDWLCFGCSFTFGQGLDDGETLPAALQRRNPGYRLHNFAMMAKSSSDAYLLLPDRLERFPETKLCIYFLIGEHFFRDSCPPQLLAQSWARQAPRFVLDANERAVLKGRALQTLSSWERFEIDLLQHSRLFALAMGNWEPAANGSRLTAALIRDMERKCSARPGCRFLLVRLPEPFPRWSAKVSACVGQLQKEGLHVLDLSDRFDQQVQAQQLDRKAFYLEEGHPNGRYMELMADWVTQYVRDWDRTGEPPCSPEADSPGARNSR
jgi:hypothetical protein